MDLLVVVDCGRSIPALDKLGAVGGGGNSAAGDAVIPND